jgi:hypothetical protein
VNPEGCERIQEIITQVELFTSDHTRLQALSVSLGGFGGPMSVGEIQCVLKLFGPDYYRMTAFGMLRRRLEGPVTQAQIESILKLFDSEHTKMMVFRQLSARAPGPGQRRSTRSPRAAPGSSPGAPGAAGTSAQAESAPRGLRWRRKRRPSVPCVPACAGAGVTGLITELTGLRETYLEIGSAKPANAEALEMAETIARIAADTSELFRRLGEKGPDDELAVAQAEYRQQLAKVLAVLGPKYYLDIVRAPHLWDKRAERTAAVKASVTAFADQIVANIQRANSAQDSSVEASLDALAREARTPRNPI